MGHLKIWDISKDDYPMVTVKEESFGFDDIDVSGDHLAACCWDKSLKLYDLSTMQVTISFRPKKITECLVFQGQRMLSGHVNGKIKEWDIRSGKATHTYAHHGSKVAALVLDVHNDIIISGGKNPPIKLWDRRKGATAQNLEGHTGIVHALHYDGPKLISGSMDTTIALWDTATGALLRRFNTDKPVIEVTAEERLLALSCLASSGVIWCHRLLDSAAEEAVEASTSHKKGCLLQ